MIDGRFATALTGELPTAGRTIQFMSSVFFQPPPRGYSYYQADGSYFGEKTDANGYYIFAVGDETPLDVPVQATVLCVAQWADRFEILGSHLSAAIPRSGQLHGSAKQRAQAIKDLYTLASEVRPAYLGLSLFGRDCYLLWADHDALPETLCLMPSQYRALQDEWLARGWPDNLFYPVDEVRFLLENIVPSDGSNQMLAQHWFSPRVWRDHERAAISGIQLPDPGQVRRSDKRAYRAFFNSLQQWMTEFGQAEKERDIQLAALFSKQEKQMHEVVAQLDDMVLSERQTT